jgi:hypothetical protein
MYDDVLINLLGSKIKSKEMPFIMCHPYLLPVERMMHYLLGSKARSDDVYNVPIEWMVY